jgi:hypothetical protein
MKILICCGLYIETRRTSLEKTESDKTAFPHYIEILNEMDVSVKTKRALLKHSVA